MRIVVVGAGIIGLATAFELDRRGHDVVVFDPEPAFGASRAAAGMLAAVTERTWGQDALAPLLAASAERYPAFVDALERATGRRVGYRRTATMALGVDAADRAALAELAALHGDRAERVTGSRARDLEPALGPAVSGGVLVQGDHQVDPRRVTAALRETLGARVRRETVVAVRGRSDARDRAGFGEGPGFGDRAGFDDRAGFGDRAGVELASGERVPADAVVVAAGLATGRIRGIPALPLRPVWGDILRLRVPERLRPLLTHTVRALVRGESVYLVPREDGELVLGATVREGGVEGVQAGGVLALLRDAERILPGIAECELVEVLARARPGSPDAIPLLGTASAGVVIATGFDRHGVLLTPLGAALAADLAEGRPIDPDVAAALDPFRFAAAPEPLRSALAGALAGAGALPDLSAPPQEGRR
ncbi:MAG: FAD-dependent oxidoreductase [Actinobacteria bacterium]|nr:FAD-dependent oxidoreductase [Actinomycetota bacterium]